ncbi:hypothetical protein D3C74_109780 [compost metagenome]
MAAVMKVKFELLLKLDDIEQALKSRGITTTPANVKRLVKLIQDSPISANNEFFEDIPTDRQILIMHGFTFIKEGTNNGKINEN